ncbi:hypothetical protein ACTWQB_10875 [Piscibacillus sp. B03]|uniref:hypothetical protein n=1 Tax=Piscibacillus sp. B03 TaxID=3457430 RepID=UPI003FCDB382
MKKDQDKHREIAKMCREILDQDRPYYQIYNLTDREKDLAIDLLLRAVLGYSERELEKGLPGMDYIENKFYAAYYHITNKLIYPSRN